MNDNIILVKSLNPKSGSVYEIDRAALTCTCPAFVYGMTRPCKHMRAVLPPAALDKPNAMRHNDSLKSAEPKVGTGMYGLYTVGHGNLTIDYLINKMLKPYDITTVVDVRSKPYSRYNPQFNRPDLAASLHKVGIRYLWGGKTLGGMNGPSVKGSKFYSDMDKVLRLAEHENVAMMCSERDPAGCHRAYKLTAYVHRLDSEVLPQHIVKAGLIDSTEFEQSLPSNWLWSEFGGSAT